MLLRFRVRNHLSIRDQQELSLVASSLKDVDEGLIDCAAAAGKRVLPAVVIYGANASGKSNIVAALRYMRSAVLNSHSRGEPGGGVPRSPFALDQASAKSSSTFDTDFVIAEMRYHYGFEASDEAFISEWLYVFPSGRRQTLFERRDQSFSFGRNLKGRNKVISDLTRTNSLFLSAATQNDHEELSKVSNFFQSLRSDSEISVHGAFASMQFAEKDVDRRVIEFLKKIGTGVVGFREKEFEVPEEIKKVQKAVFSVIQEISSEVPQFIPPVDEKIIAIELAHRSVDGTDVYFDLDRESAGTRRLLILLGRVFRALDRGGPLVVDELDASLHTHACEALLELFSSPKSNPNGAQLIATTHDTNLLRSGLLRRDQVWFTEKDAKSATHLYPLTDIRTRRDDNLEKGYLQGRYGAVPFSGPMPDLISAG